MTSFITKDVGKDTYGAIVYGTDGQCLWSSAVGLTREEAEKALADWKTQYNWGVKA